MPMKLRLTILFLVRVLGLRHRSALLDRTLHAARDRLPEGRRPTGGMGARRPGKRPRMESCTWKKPTRCRARTSACTGPIPSRASTAKLARSSPTACAEPRCTSGRTCARWGRTSSPRRRRTLCCGIPSSTSPAFTKPVTRWGYRTPPTSPTSCTSFGYGKGDIREYFGRYRRKLRDARGYREELGNLAAGSGEAYSGAEVTVFFGGGIASPRFIEPPPSLT